LRRRQQLKPEVLYGNSSEYAPLQAIKSFILAYFPTFGYDHALSEVFRMKQVASLRYEVIFKKVFTQLDIFTAFVKDFTGVQIEIDKVETEKTFANPIGNVNSRFDLFAEDKKNRIIVDIQHVRFSDHYHRFLHYHCAAILEQISSSESYSPALQVFTIVVLTSSDKHKTDISMIDFDPKDLNNKPLKEIPHKVIYLCPKYVTDQTPQPYREWLQAINDSLDGEVDETFYQRDEIKRIFSIIEKDQISPQEYARMKDEYGYEEIGRDQFNKGVEKGIEKGVFLEKCYIIKTMLGEGFDIKTISKITQLSEEQIDHILNNFTQGN
jgi:predicted transposase/invertase (TIGR01784 family)